MLSKWCQVKKKKTFLNTLHCVAFASTQTSITQKRVQCKQHLIPYKNLRCSEIVAFQPQTSFSLQDNVITNEYIVQN